MKINNSKIIMAVGIVYVIIQLISTVAIISLQLDARSNRQVIRAQNDFLVCVLQTQPADRTDATIQACREQATAR
jgi:hypothetical protein